ncbi:UDP-N-acetylglucosamine 2-epimerase (non-hydrolyzing) [candidate division KSB3 bacterium]|nr:MAG: UDP-N-acetylglucosamine 2-epimerase (non-hydrolyzing) [candidate division KSB3 bacterium]
MLNIVTLVGARPQFIKAAPVCRALREAGHRELLVHTGQHYDADMSEIFFQELHIPEPARNLEVGSGSHGRQTGHMLIRIEEVLLAEKPDWVLIYGDTNSTVAGALAAVKLHIPVAHMEAGLRSFNRKMPEEHNRVVADHLSDVLLCPTQIAVNNLANEGITEGVHLVGDVMYDSLRYNLHLAEERSHILDSLGLSPKRYILATVHRAENTDTPERLRSIFSAFERIAQQDIEVVLPLHPRTRNKLDALDLSLTKLRILPPVPYLDMLALAQHAKAILTDSGGLQKEAYWLKVPCITLRDETEWIETVDTGWNVIVGANAELIVEQCFHFIEPASHPLLYGDGQTAGRCVSLLGAA